MMSGTLLLMLLLLLMSEGLRRGCSVAAFFSLFFFSNLFCFVFCVLLCWCVLSVEVEVPWMLMFIVRGSSVAVAVAVRGLAISTLYFRVQLISTRLSTLKLHTQE